MNHDHEDTTAHSPILQKSYSLEFKKYMVCYIGNTTKKKGVPVHVACEELNLSHSLTLTGRRCWSKLPKYKIPICFMQHQWEQSPGSS